MSETFYKLPEPYNNYLGRFKSTNADRTDKKIPNIFYFDFGRIDIIDNYLNYMYGDYNENRNSTLADEWVQLLRIKETDKQPVNPKKPEKSIFVYYQLKNRGDSGEGPPNASAVAGGGGGGSGDSSQALPNAGAVAGGGGNPSQGPLNAGADGGPNNFSEFISEIVASALTSPVDNKQQDSKSGSSIFGNFGKSSLFNLSNAKKLSSINLPSSSSSINSPSSSSSINSPSSSSPNNSPSSSSSINSPSSSINSPSSSINSPSSSLNTGINVVNKPSLSPSIIFDKSFSDPDKNTLTRIIEKLREKGILPNKRENTSPPISVSTYSPTSGYTYRPRLGSPTTFGSLPTACDNLVDFSRSRNAVAVIDKCTLDNQTASPDKTQFIPQP